ncbi:MAG: NB-ARC domain-containing protein, partial [Cyanobacteriota bacterium]
LNGLRKAGWPAIGLAFVWAKSKVFAATTPASPSLPTSQVELKELVSRWLLRHGQGGAMALGLAVLFWVLLTQLQNIEAGFRMVGQLLSKGRKTVAPDPSVADPSRPIHITIQSPPPPPDSRSTPSVAGALTNLPPARSGFVARAAELQQLATDLAPEAAQVVIHGLPGVGKTTLARHYAHGANATYPGGVWWLDASQGFEPMVLDAVTELEARIPGLGKVEGLTLEPRLRRCFQAWPGEKSEAVLLVVDNLPAPPEGLEMMRRLTTGLPPRFRRLLTQRPKPPSNAEGLKLPVVASEDALEVFKTRSGVSGRLRIEREQEEARELVEDVGRLPLALVLLGGRLDRVPSLTLGVLRKDLARSTLEAKAFAKDNADFQGEQGLVAILLTSWAVLGSEAMELARLLSLTLPAPIPWELIECCVPSGPPSSPQTIDRHWEDALAELVGANLLDALDGDRPLYALHPLVRQFFSLQRRRWEPEPHWRRDLLTGARALAKGCEGVDLPRSVDYWRQATHADPTDWAAAYGLGYGLIPLGDSEGARQAFEQSRSNAEAADEPRGVSCAWAGIGDVRRAQGNGPGALAAYQAGLTIAEDLAKRDPANTEWHRDLSVSHYRIGDVLVSQGNGPGALAAYHAGLTIAEDLAKRDPANTQWQRDLSVSNTKIGDVLVSQGNGPGALAAYQASLTILEDLAKRDPANTQWQVDVAISCSRLGTIESLLSVDERYSHLQRGRDILLALKESGRLHANQDYIGWFEEQLQQLGCAQ